MSLAAARESRIGSIYFSTLKSGKGFKTDPNMKNLYNGGCFKTLHLFLPSHQLACFLGFR